MNRKHYDTRWNKGIAARYKALAVRIWAEDTQSDETVLEPLVRAGNGKFWDVEDSLLQVLDGNGAVHCQYGDTE